MMLSDVCLSDVCRVAAARLQLVNIYRAVADTTWRKELTLLD